MKAGHQSGFTVLEVMIFLAISSLVFISAVVAIGGRQESTQYSQGIRELDMTIQAVINDVASGYYPQSNINCVVAGGSLNFPAGGEQGSNRDCMFLGKAIQFAEQGTDQEGLVIYSLAGRRMQAAPNHRQDVATLTQALPTAVGALTERVDTAYGLRITRVVRRGGNSSHQAPFVAFLSSLGKYSAADKSLASSARTTRMATILGGTSVNMSASTVEATIRGLADSHVQIASRGIVICVESTSRRFAGAIGIGLDGGGMTTTVDQDIRGSGRFSECTA